MNHWKKKEPFNNEINFWFTKKKRNQFLNHGCWKVIKDITKHLSNSNSLNPTFFNNNKIKIRSLDFAAFSCFTFKWSYYILLLLYLFFFFFCSMVHNCWRLVLTIKLIFFSLIAPFKTKQYSEWKSMKPWVNIQAT